MLLLLLLPCAILVGVIPFAWRQQMLVAVGVTFITWAIIARIPPRELGLRTDNLVSALRAQVPITILFLLFLGLAPRLGLSGRFYIPSAKFFVFFVLISSPIQEFIYRAFLHALSARANLPRVWVRLVLILPYVWVHVIYRDWMTMIFTLAVGAFWGVTYDRIPNLWAVAATHALLGLITLSLGMI